MSSITITWRPSMLASRSLRIRTTPGGVGAVAVAGDGHEVDLARDGDAPDQVGHEEHGALEHAHQQQVEARVVARELLAQLVDPRRAARRLSTSTSAISGSRSRPVCSTFIAAEDTGSRRRRTRGSSGRAPPRGRGRATAARRRCARSASASSLAVSARGSRSGRPAARSAASRSTSTRSARGMSSSAVAGRAVGSTCSPASSRQQLVQLAQQLGGAGQVRPRRRGGRGAAPASPRAGSGCGAGGCRCWSRPRAAATPCSAHHARVSAAVSAQQRPHDPARARPHRPDRPRARRRRRAGRAPSRPGRRACARSRSAGRRRARGRRRSGPRGRAPRGSPPGRDVDRDDLAPSAGAVGGVGQAVGAAQAVLDVQRLDRVAELAQQRPQAQTESAPPDTSASTGSPGLEQRDARRCMPRRDSLRGGAAIIDQATNVRMKVVPSSM